MDEFKPEDELKPDTSDRRPTRQQKSSRFSAPKITLSRQHLMIGIGIVVLVLLIIGIGSALKAPSRPETSQAQSQSGDEKSIDLSASSSMTQDSQPVTSTENPAAVPGEATHAPQTLSAPPISGTPTEAAVQPPPSGQQRIELPGNITDALSQQQGRVDEFSQGATGTTLPSAPATLAPAAKTPAVEKNTHSSRPATTGTPKAAPPAVTSKPANAGNASPASDRSIQTAPDSHFTLQLSSASRSDTLAAYAKQHNLSHSWVYETKRDGKSWYVLVTGVYASPAEARQAIATLPADVQAKKPWVKPIRQVKQDLNK
ncbi:SPOR domain-containing protein [Brenneria roseae subsp. roseae]|uniref:SPOR domain-containing protein n=1 Tax=Brenneria roseae TaxID=1509241 RepID=UPI000D603495|nr:SPOR domain-containing protein [Brenneria roseae]PWC16630.1 SPOR domain-containing protein [Brenneria roseae subsp. roseae]